MWFVLGSRRAHSSSSSYFFFIRTFCLHTRIQFIVCLEQSKQTGTIQSCIFLRTTFYFPNCVSYLVTFYAEWGRRQVEKLIWYRILTHPQTYCLKIINSRNQTITTSLTSDNVYWHSGQSMFFFSIDWAHYNNEQNS